LDYTYKKDFTKAKEHHTAFWNKSGMAVTINLPSKTSMLYHNIKSETEYYRRLHTDVDFAICDIKTKLENKTFISDNLPILMPEYGTVSQAPLLGAKIEYGEETIWYHPTIEENDDESLAFDQKAPLWLFLQQVFKRIKVSNLENAIIGCPGFSPGLDCLSVLRGDSALLMDMIDRPDWVHRRLSEINRTYYEIYNLTYPLICQKDKSSAFGYFDIWGMGKTSQFQCDLAATLSPAMFDEFVIPYLTEQCSWIDHSLYHVDGTQCLSQIDALLAINELTAIEFTPQYGIEGGGNPRWYPLYEKILSAGKSVQVLGAMAHEVIPLLKAIGTKGVFVYSFAKDLDEAKRIEDKIEKIR